MTVISHAGSCLNGHVQTLSTGTNKRALKSAPIQFGGDLIVANLVSGAIHIYMQKDLGGSIEWFKFYPKETLKKMFEKSMMMK